MKGAVGNWVMGEEFWGRDHEITELRELLDAGAHVLLVAPRRVGKTSLMRELGRRLDTTHRCLFVDLEGAQSAADAIAELGLATRPHQSLWKRTQDVFRGLLDNVDTIGAYEVSIKLREGTAAGWQTRGQRLLDSLAQHDEPIIVFMDELPILINRMLKGDDYQITPERRREADMFLSFLRAETTRRKGQVRFVAAGSIGLEPVLRQAGLSATVNTFTPYELHPWDRPTAIGFLNAISESKKLVLGAGAAERMVERLGSAVPHHVQLFFDLVLQDARRRKMGEATITDIERVFAERMLSTRGHAELSHLEERLKMVLGPKRLPVALDLLTEAAVTGSLQPERAMEIAKEAVGTGDLDEERPEDLLRELLGIFEHDGYLERSDGGYVFVSSLVRDWWKARFGYFARSGRSR
ncbi:MAG: ATP-binding protein [Polyangiaceae bacterium]